jgi:hypothetical protein
MKKASTKLSLNRETVALLGASHLRRIRGGGASENYGECLTDRCSEAYCFTTGPTCPREDDQGSA